MDVQPITPNIFGGDLDIISKAGKGLVALIKFEASFDFNSFLANTSILDIDIIKDKGPSRSGLGLIGVLLIKLGLIFFLIPRFFA